jgi:hypothetical protein
MAFNGEEVVHKGSMQKDDYRRKIMYTWKEVNQQESLLLYKEDLIQVWLPKRQNLLI